MQSIAAIGLLILLLLAAVSGTAESSQQPPEEVDLATFIAHVERLADSLEDASPEMVRAALPTMPPLFRVRAGVAHIEVALDPLIAALAQQDVSREEWLQRRDHVRARLLDLRSEAGALLVQIERPPVDAGRASLAMVLERREFGARQPTRVTRQIERLRQWLRELWSRVGGEHVDGRRAALVMIWLATAAAMGCALVWAYRVARRHPLLLDRHVPAPPTAVPATARAWGLRALEAARDGRTREAVRCTYRAAVTRLEEQGVWRVDDARTGREYVTLLPPDDARRGRISEIVGEFERVVYANEPVSRHDVDRLAAHLEALGCVAPRTQPT